MSTIGEKTCNIKELKIKRNLGYRQAAMEVTTEGGQRSDFRLKSRRMGMKLKLQGNNIPTSKLIFLLIQKLIIP